MPYSAREVLAKLRRAGFEEARQSGSHNMNLFDLYEVSRKPRRAKSLYERARKYIGAVKGPLTPKNTAAQAKALVRGIAAAKHSR